MCLSTYIFSFLFLGEPATPDICTLSLHDALPISRRIRRPPRPSPSTSGRRSGRGRGSACPTWPARSYSRPSSTDRKSTRLNSSHVEISYAVFCLKKKRGTSIQNDARRSLSHTPRL